MITFIVYKIWSHTLSSTGSYGKLANFDFLKFAIDQKFYDLTKLHCYYNRMSIFKLVLLAKAWF